MAVGVVGPRHFGDGRYAAIGLALLALDRASGRMGASDERYEPDHSNRRRDRSCAQFSAQPLSRREDADGRSPSGRRPRTLEIHWNRWGPVAIDRKSVVSGKSVSVRVDRGGRRSIKKKKKYKILIQ